jgi:hypothetical protein
MRMSRMRTIGSTALVLAAMVSLGSVQPTLAGTQSTVGVDGVVLQGSGPSTWEAFTNSSSGCSQTGFTPVDDGSLRGRTDAFDDGLIMGIDGTGFDDYDGTVPGAPLAKETIETSNNIDFPALSVQRADRVLPSSDVLRTVVRFKNTDTSAQTLTIEWDSNVGSDGSTGVRGSSSGDAVYTKVDRWVVSSDNPTTPVDPVLIFALFGKGAAVKTDSVVSAIGSGVDCFTIDFSLRVQAGGTRYLMFFTEMRGTNAKGKAAAKKFNSVAAGSWLLGGLKASVLNRIANWDL